MRVTSSHWIDSDPSHKRTPALTLTGQRWGSTAAEEPMVTNSTCLTCASPEVWRTHPDCIGYYEVSTHGRVYSAPRTVTRSNGIPCRVRGCLLTLTANEDGYSTVGLRTSPSVQPRTCKVHRLVLETFVGPRPEGMEGCHGDGNPAHNHIGNLYWGTRSENMLDRVRHGTHHMANRDSCPLEHVLTIPNLVVWQWEHRGHRACLACYRASQQKWRAYKRGLPFDFEVTAHAHYARIMGETIAG